MSLTPSQSQPPSNPSLLWQARLYQLQSTIPGSQTEKQEVIRKRILKFFGENNRLSENYFNERRDADLTNANLIFDTSKIILFGVDYLSKKSTEQYFSQFHTQVQRIDDSHSLVSFSNEGECLRALSAKNSRKDVFGSFGEVMGKSKDGWVELNSYFQMLFERKLLARFSSNLDNCQQQDRTKFFIHYMAVKKKFLQTFTHERISQPVSLYQTPKRPEKIDKKMKNYYQENRGRIVICCHHQNRCGRSTSKDRQKSKSRSRNKDWGYEKNDIEFEKYCRRRDESTKLKKKPQDYKHPNKDELNISTLLNLSEMKSRNSSNETQDKKVDLIDYQNVQVVQKESDYLVSPRSRSYSRFEAEFVDKCHI